MAGPLKGSIDAMISTLDSQNVARTSTTQQHDPGSMVAILQARGMHEEAQQLAAAWTRVRAILDQASSKAGKQGF